MKQKYASISFFFSLVLLAAILLQSIHSLHHLEQFISKVHCHHQYAQNKTEINHTHQDFDHCYACEFSLSNCTSFTVTTFDFQKKEISTGYTFSYSKQITQSFSGALFALRAPPCFI